MAPNLTKRRKWLAELNEETNVPFKYVSNYNDNCFCVICEKTFSGAQKSELVQHLGRAKHKANKEIKKKRTVSQALLEEVTGPQTKKKSKEEELGLELTRAFLAADIPLFKLENKFLQEALEKNAGIVLPQESHCRKKYVPACYDETMDKIRQELSTGYLWVSSDCSRDSQGREVAHVLMGKLDSDQYTKPFLVHVEFLEKADGDAMARLINTAFQNLDANFDPNRALIYMSDGAPYMKKSGRNLRVFYPKLLHVTCSAHGLSLVCEKALDVFPKVNRLIASTKAVLVKAPMRSGNQ